MFHRQVQPTREESFIQLWENLSGYFLMVQLKRSTDQTAQPVWKCSTIQGPWVALMDNSHLTGKGWELYNIETDTGQNNNVAGQNPDLLK